MIFEVFIFLSFLKLLFWPAYRSTDFEVHRNWLAVTHSTNIKQWYFEETSEWTLDYPPIFAYFEYGLSTIAKLFDHEMLKVENLKYASESTVLYQRLSVIITDVIYFMGVKECSKVLPKSQKTALASTLLLANIGLLYVDHIHFQYNGILFGILLLSIGKMLQMQYIQSTFYYAWLINMKHIFIYIGPVYFVYLIKYYIVGRKFIPNFTKVGSVATLVTLFAFGPFIKQLPQVLSRLFPFKRGLSHAYWAPNFWAIYNFGDKVLAKVKNIKSSDNTGGLVQTFDHAVLPSISPLTTFIITSIMMIPCLLKLSINSKKRYYYNMKFIYHSFIYFYFFSTSAVNFIKPLVICAATSFMFGWHVHEKAVLMILIPLFVSSNIHSNDAEACLFVSIIGHYSLFPLLFPTELTLFKASLFLLYIGFNVFSRKLAQTYQGISKFKKIYCLGLMGIFIYEYLIQFIIGFDTKLPFLPLLLTSVYCSIGVTWFWMNFYINYLFL
ncbi:unnamed protein product [Diamesa tonsa]